MIRIKSAVKKTAVFMMYWMITGSFAFLLDYVVFGEEKAWNQKLWMTAEECTAEVSDILVPENLESGNNDTGNGQKKRIALSFDDGPHAVYTEMLLDGLAERNVKAAFFVVGKNIAGNEKLISRMYQEGHVIGNHTYDHVKLCELSDAEACEQIEKTNTLIRKITGTELEFVRPPFGEWNHDMECSFTMIPVLWDVDPLDWTTKNQHQIVQHVLKEVKDGDIILLHDYYESSVGAALQIVDELQKQGYEFVTIDEMILD